MSDTNSQPALTTPFSTAVASPTADATGTPSQTGLSTGSKGVIGGTVGIFMIVLVSLATVCMLRRRKRTKPRQSSEKSELPSGSLHLGSQDPAEGQPPGSDPRVNAYELPNPVCGLHLEELLEIAGPETRNCS